MDIIFLIIDKKNKMYVINLLNIMFIEYLLLTNKDIYTIYYLLFMPIIIVFILKEFIKIKYQYFMLDFCYFTIFATFIDCIFNIPWLSQILFIHTTASLTMAIIIWNNSIVLHKMDKMASIYIHILPNILYYCNGCDVLTTIDYINAIKFYLIWQIIYCIITEIIYKPKYGYETSLRYMTNNLYKNKIRIIILDICKKIGLFEKYEEFNNESIKTKMVYMISQFIYMLITLIIPWLISTSTILHLIYILILFIVGIMNGNKYYKKIKID